MQPTDHGSNPVLSEPFRPPLGPTVLLPVQCEPWFFLGFKLPARETGAEVKNEWSSTSIISS